MGEAFIEQLPIEKFFGVGKVTAKKMKDKYIHLGGDLKTKSRAQLNRWFGKAGNYYFNIARGVDNRIVNPHRERKSIGAERTYAVDLTTKESIIEKLESIVEILIKRMNNSDKSGKTLILKIKYSDFKQITRSKTKNEPILESEIEAMVYQLVDQLEDLEIGVRLLGLAISNFYSDDVDDKFLGQMEMKF